MKQPRAGALADISDDDALANAYERGLAAEKAGDVKGAAKAYREVLRLDPADHGGVAVRLASIGQAPDPDRAPEAYVTTLFDQQAPQFDEILVARLGYRVPEMIAEALRDAELGPFTRALDVGCGTGLVGVALEGRLGQLIGVDLSEEMLAETDDRDLYDQLFVGEAIQFLKEEGTPFDLIVAADVLPYLGGLETFFAALRPCLTEGGVLALSTETLPERAFDTRGWKVGTKTRFAHAESYLRALIASHQLEIVTFKEITVRMDEGEGIPGHLVLARAS
ncbi:MAG: methyltransferase [Pseudomonadota bacterium]